MALLPSATRKPISMTLRSRYSVARRRWLPSEAKGRALASGGGRRCCRGISRDSAAWGVTSRGKRRLHRRSLPPSCGSSRRRPTASAIPMWLPPTAAAAPGLWIRSRHLGARVSSNAMRGCILNARQCGSGATGLTAGGGIARAIRPVGAGSCHGSAQGGILARVSRAAEAARQARATRQQRTISFRYGRVHRHRWRRFQ